MKLVPITAGLFAIGVILGASSLIRAEEITLKDGQKIVGTIVGYEKEMFRIETDYGIALVRKDKVVSIQVTKPGTTVSSPQPSAPPVRKSIEVKPTHVAVAPEVAPVSPAPPSAPMKLPPPAPPPPSAEHIMASPVAAESLVPPPIAAKPAAPPAPANHPDPPPPPVQAQALSSEPAKIPAPPPVAAKPLPPPVPAKPPAPPPPPVSHPMDVPLPAHLQEHLDGNTYFNDSFQFSMFKPFDWKIYEGVPKETGSGIMAMGTEDEQTLLIVDRQVWSGTPKLTSDEVEAKLRQTYQEYRRISEEAVVCDGHTATRRTFTGIMDGVEWHGVAVHVIHGNMVLGLTGLTSAETFQFQEAVLNKIIKTLHFLTSPTPSAASATP